MNTKKTITKIFLSLVWLAVGTGLLVLLIAAIGKKNRQECSGYTITLKGGADHFFLEKNDIKELLMAATRGKIKGQAMSSFNLMKVESFLEDNVWIKDAELYFDNKDLLHVAVLERQPLARIFTKANTSFYIDSNLVRMPLSENYSARVPVFTGFPEKKFLNKKDSALLTQVKNMAVFINNDSFWMAQVSQMDITDEGQFEMLPTIGDHVVKLGNGNNIEKKFHRLFIFYMQVLRKTGFDKYSTIDVQFSGQVVGTPRGAGSTKVDAAKLRANILNLLQKSKEIQQKAINESKSSNQSLAPAEKQIMPAKSNQTIKQKQAENSSPDPAKPTSVTPMKNQQENRVPKAVMPKKQTEEQ